MLCRVGGRLISPADGSECIGIFLDFPGKVSYDIGYTRHDTLRFAAAESDYALYLITAPTAAEAAKEFRQLIGPSYIPPKWAFLPYLYSEFMKAALEDAPYFRPLAFDYSADSDAREVEDQLLLGEGLMIAPIYTQNAHGRTVSLCPTGCTPMTASPPTLISPTTGASSGNTPPDAAKLSPSPVTRSSETPAARRDEKLLTNAAERVTLFAL